MKAELLAAGYSQVRHLRGDEIASFYAKYMGRENIARREDMKSLSTDPNAERQEQSFAHRDAGGTYRPRDEPLGEEEAVEDIERVMEEEDPDLVIPEDEEHRGRAPARFEGLGGGLARPEGAGGLLPPP
jgi:hypothetical protein